MFENICKIFILGQVNRMVCDISHYLDSETKFNGANIDHFKCVRKFKLYVMQEKFISIHKYGIIHVKP